MVNVGGPSRGCVTCIRRKIRCDQQRPTCTQCQRGGRQCEGYRSEIDLVFRDQTQTMFARGAWTLQSPPQPPEDTASLDNLPNTHNNVAGLGTWSASDVSPTIRSPQLNAASGLVNFFANNFTWSGSNSGSNLFWIPNNFDVLLKNDCAKFSVQSAGAMALACLQRSSYFHREAQRDYGLALLNLGKLWQQHTEIDKDAILITILFLGFFEILASYQSSSRQSWLTHLGGLGLLLKRREGHFFATGFGVRMLLQSRSQAILNALQTKTPVPEAFCNPSPSVHPSMPPNVVQSEKANALLIRLAALQSQYETLGPSDDLLGELAALDIALSQWTESVHPSWSFSSQPSGLHSDCWWDVRCDVYSAAVVAHVWNKIRAARVIVYDLMQDMSLRLSSHGRDDVSMKMDLISHHTVDPTLQQLVTDICATVPIYYRQTSVAASSSTTGDPPLLGTTYWLLWPLEVVGSMRTAPLSLREWVRKCLNRIYDTTGIMKAKLAADRVEMGYRRAIVAQN